MKRHDDHQAIMDELTSFPLAVVALTVLGSSKKPFAFKYSTFLKKIKWTNNLISIKTKQWKETNPSATSELTCPWVVLCDPSWEIWCGSLLLHSWLPWKKSQRWVRVRSQGQIYIKYFPYRVHTMSDQGSLGPASHISQHPLQLHPEELSDASVS